MRRYVYLFMQIIYVKIYICIYNNIYITSVCACVRVDFVGEVSKVKYCS